MVDTRLTHELVMRHNARIGRDLHAKPLFSRKMPRQDQTVLFAPFADLRGIVLHEHFADERVIAVAKRLICFALFLEKKVKAVQHVFPVALAIERGEFYAPCAGGNVDLRFVGKYALDRFPELLPEMFFVYFMRATDEFLRDGRIEQIYIMFLHFKIYIQIGVFDLRRSLISLLRLSVCGEKAVGFRFIR